ncbi:MAG: hypothetical protein VCB06_02175 [Alphaproteobacteria bacterium]
MLSHWLDMAPLASEDKPPTLHGTTCADACIAGGKFCGLWTATRLTERDAWSECGLVRDSVG